MKKFTAITFTFICVSLIFVSYKFYLKNKLENTFLPVSSINSPWITAKLEKKILDEQYIPEESTNIQFKSINFQVPLSKSAIEDLLDKGSPHENIEGKSTSYKVTFNTGQKIILLKRETTLLNNKNAGYFISDAKKVYLSKNVLDELSVFENEYNLSKFLFSQRPENIHLYNSNKDLDMKYELLGLKSTAQAIGSESYLSFFEINELKGFQLCKPELPDCTTTQIQFYLADYDSNFFILFKGFNQKEIDYMIRSIKNI